MPIVSIKSPNAVKANKSNQGYRNIFNKAVESSKPNKEDVKSTVAWSRINHKFQKDQTGKWRRKESMNKSEEIQTLFKNAQLYRQLVNAGKSVGRGTVRTLSGRNLEAAQNRLADVTSKLQLFKNVPKGVEGIKPSIINKARGLIDGKDRPAKISPKFKRDKLFGLFGKAKLDSTTYKVKNKSEGGFTTTYGKLVPPNQGPLNKQYQEYLAANNVQGKYEDWLTRNNSVTMGNPTFNQFASTNFPFSGFVEQRYNDILKEQYHAQMRLLWERIKRYGLMGGGGAAIGANINRTDK